MGTGGAPKNMIIFLIFDGEQSLSYSLTFKLKKNIVKLWSHPYYWSK